MFQTGNIFPDDDWMPINGPLSQDGDTALLVRGRRNAIERAAKQWKTARLLDAFRRRLPLLVTDLGRTSLLADAAMRRLVDEGAARDGSSTAISLPTY